MEQLDAAFDNRFTQTFGGPVEKIRTKIKPQLTDPIKAFIREAPFAVMATSDPDGRCDASPKGGKPGFVRIIDDEHLLVPDIAGNRLFQSYQNMDSNPHVGLVFFIPGLAEVVRVNGRIKIVERDEALRVGVEPTMYNPNGDREVLQGIVIQVDEAYTHCPRALTYSNLWDPEVIEWRRSSGSHPLRPPVQPEARP